MSALLDLQVDRLLERVRRHVESECATISWDAEQKVAALLADARREARLRIREAARAKRERVAEHCRRALAIAEAAGRAAAFAAERGLLDRAAQRLPAALAARWRDRDARLAWALAALNLAARRLVARDWRATTAPGLDPEQRAVLVARAAELGARLEFDADAGDCGLVIASRGARVDATARGLLADEAEIASRVLAELRRGRPA